jgi:hypothetical protein
VKSKPVKVSGKLFRYDFDRSVVEYIIEADAETISEENEWKQKHGSALFCIDSEGYIVCSIAGLNVANWKNVAARKEYLSEWADELSEEESCLVDDFAKNELPFLNEKTK